MLEDSLREKLAHRPQPGDVIQKGILNRKFQLWAPGFRTKMLIKTYLADEDPTNAQ